jgi:hypothetical protein
MHRGKRYEPHAHAEALGLEVAYARLREGRKGEYRHRDKLIVVRRGLSGRQERCTLTHEIMHALAGHRRSPFGIVNARQEAHADRMASMHLICPDEYALAEELHGSHAGALADELDVTLHMLRVWRRAALLKVAS